LPPGSRAGLREPRIQDPDQSADWIHAPNPSLGKQQPLTLLDTDIGVQQVDQVLGRIEHGIVG
jgi:uncharacterized protein (DUF2384 family)